MVTRWLVVLVLLSAACSGDGSASGEATATTEAQRVDPIDVTVADQLPLVASPVAVHGDIGVYFITAGTEQRVVAVDLAEQRVLWGKPSHQQGRIRGVVVAPYVDPAGSRVVVTQWKPYPGESDLVSFDLETGREQWRTPVEWAELPPEHCADGALCIPTYEGLAQYDPASGAFVGYVEGGLERSITATGDLRLSADPGGGRLELGEIVPGGYEVRWQQTLADFVPGDVAARYGPDGGWNGHVDEDTGETVFLFGTLPPAAAYEDDEYEATDEEMRADARAGFLVGLVDGTGEPVLGAPGVYDCRDLPFEPGGFWTCEDVDVVEQEDHDDDGRADPEPVFRRMVRRTSADPDGDLVVELPAPIPYFGGGIRPTSDPDLFVLTPFPADGDPVVLDIADGGIAPIEQHADLVSACLLPEEEDVTSVTEDPMYVELDTFDGETDRYLTVHGPLGVCTLDGDPIDPAEALARGPLADWFGIAIDVEDPVDDEWSTTAGGWVLWTETDRVLRIAELDPDPTVSEQS